MWGKSGISEGKVVVTVVVADVEVIVVERGGESVSGMVIIVDGSGVWRERMGDCDEWVM